MSLIKNSKLIIIRPGPCTNVKGHLTPTADTIYNIEANVQPVNGEELLLLKEGNRRRGTIKIYSEFEILNNDRVREDKYNVAKVVTCTIDNVIDETEYTITINGHEYSYESGIGATNLEIVIGLISDIDDVTENITIVDNLDGTYTITANVKGTPFTIEVDENQSINIDTENVTKQYEVQQDKDYSEFNISYYKTYGFLMGT